MAERGARSPPGAALSCHRKGSVVTVHDFSGGFGYKWVDLLCHENLLE